ncbi:unnamed protein product [Pleuronectes platessa]|uniref:Uncharacterized protein n=1 Tax=Pleuronectes platessa TaxID=8262 RepID=A0A9N7W3D4_PLEPL|nr:unnamed protein product [Pleuronectes platessa]
MRQKHVTAPTHLAASSNQETGVCADGRGLLVLLRRGGFQPEHREEDGGEDRDRSSRDPDSVSRSSPSSSSSSSSSSCHHFLQELCVSMHFLPRTIHAPCTHHLLRALPLSLLLCGQ